MRVRLKVENGATIVCNSPACVREWLDMGAELEDPADLEVVARESAEDPVMRGPGESGD